MNKVTIVHPARQHSYRTAEALIKTGKLHRYITTVYYKNNVFWKIVKCFLPRRFKFKLQSKHNGELDRGNYVCTVNELLGLFYLILMNVDKQKRVTPRFYTYLLNKFGKNAAKQVSDDVRAVIGYDITATKTFSELKKRNDNIVTILDMTSSPVGCIRDILVDEYSMAINKHNALLENDYAIKLREYSTKCVLYYMKEFEYTDYFLAPSTHVKDMLVSKGINEEKIHVIPFGVDLCKFNYVNRPPISQESIINFLFVGRVEGAKGIHYLLEAVDVLGRKRTDFKLTMVGNIGCNKKIIDKYPFCHFVGQVSSDEIVNYYRNADVFIMPSLWEGFSLSLMEALSTGLPVIATKVSGGEDIIVNQRNGLLINSQSTEEIISGIEWILDNKSKIRLMGKEATNSVASYTWSAYSDNICHFIDLCCR